MSTNHSAAQERESHYVDIIRRRLDLSAEARGTIGSGRPISTIRAEQAAVETEARVFRIEHGFGP